MDICKKCKKEFKQWRSLYLKGYELCHECDDKRIKKEWLVGSLAVVGVLLVIFGIRYAYAKIVYHDARCMFAECRIMK